LPVHVLDGRDAQGFAFGVEGVVLAAGVLDVVEHLLSGDALGAAGVGARAGEHLADLGAAMGADDNLGAAAGRDAAGVGVLADEFEIAKAHDHGLGRLQLFVDLALFLREGHVLLELLERKN
jgi:hypothetical protein